MQKFTVTEISWIIGELSKTAENLKNQAGKEENSGIAAGFMNLRSEQLVSVADKLQKAISDGNKQIKIKRGKKKTLELRRVL